MHHGPGPCGPALIVGHRHGRSVRGRGGPAIPGDGVEQGVILRPRVQDGISPARRPVNPGSQITRTARDEIRHHDRTVSEQRTEMLAIQDLVHVELPPAAHDCLRSTEQRAHTPDTENTRPGLSRNIAAAEGSSGPVILTTHHGNLPPSGIPAILSTSQDADLPIHPRTRPRTPITVTANPRQCPTPDARAAKRRTTASCSSAVRPAQDV